MNEEKEIDLKDKMLSDDDLGQVSGGIDLIGAYKREQNEQGNLPNPVPYY